MKKNGEFFVEDVGLGLLTRYAHPNLITYPSLPHHEQDPDLAGHYDLGVIIKNPDASIDTYHLQVKSGCFGLCDNDKPYENYEKVLSRYRPYIQLVSGCCHLESRKSAAKTKVAKLLVKESDGNATTDEIKYLDNITDNLIFKMTTEQLPRGQAVGKGIHFNTESFMRFI